MQLDPKQVEVVDDQVADILSRKSPAERLHIGFEIWASVRRMLLSHISHTHPEWSPQDVESEVAKRMLHGAV